MAISAVVPAPERLRSVARRIERQAAPTDMQLDLALLGLFSDLDAFDGLVLSELGNDIAACERALAQDEPLGFREFLGLFFAQG
ncbi:MAG: hypothetical protein IT307_14070 [Chloroflexi bacterium]|nr:hypothetical protein [Chloroflexota bacterium]